LIAGAPINRQISSARSENFINYSTRPNLTQSCFCRRF